MSGEVKSVVNGGWGSEGMADEGLPMECSEFTALEMVGMRRDVTHR